MKTVIITSVAIAVCWFATVQLDKCKDLSQSACDHAKYNHEVLKSNTAFDDMRNYQRYGASPSGYDSHENMVKQVYRKAKVFYKEAREWGV